MHRGNVLYNAKGVQQRVSPHQYPIRRSSRNQEYAKLREAVDDFPEKPEDIYSYADYIIDLREAGEALSRLKINFTIKRMKGQVSLGPPLPSLVGQPVHVHVPNIGLLSMTEVTVEENCCTDKLQGRLDEGWRILCVCPPNDARRPDYILGRAKDVE